MVHGEDGALPFVRHEGRNAALGSAFKIEGGVSEVAQHGAGGGVLARAAAIIEGVTHDVAAHIDRVEDMVHAGQHVRIGDERRADADLHGRAAARSRVAGWLGLFHDAELLDGVVELAGKPDVERGDRADAFDVNLLRVHPESVRERGEDANLVHRVEAIDVERRFDFGVAEPLSVGERLGEFGAFEFHASEDVIAGAVDDAIEARDAIADQSFAQDLDDRDTSRHARFVVKIRPVLLRRRE